MSLDPIPVNPDAQFLIQDLAQGDETVAENELFRNLREEDVLAGINLIRNNKYLSEASKIEILSNLWRINYKKKPPTIEEFLTDDWLGPMHESLYPHARNILINFWRDNSPYRHLILAMAIGTGKSTISAIHNLYVTTLLFLMWNPKKFFGLAPSTSVVQALISFSMEKAEQLLLQPFLQILLTSKRYHRVKQEEHLPRHQEENPDKICWTTAGRIGKLQFTNDIHYIIASTPYQLLGLNLIQATLSEISFFIERGLSPDYVWRIFQDCKGRIQARFGADKRLCGVVLDSSPNDIDASPIDKYIFNGEAAKDPKNYVVTGSQWEMFEQDPDLKRIKENYPIYAKTGETFKVFRGSSTMPAEIVTEERAKEFDSAVIQETPIDLHTIYKENTTKCVKDYGGWPAGTTDKLIHEMSLIEGVFTPQLKNFYTYILAPSTQSSSGLIWNQVRDKFFMKIGERRYEFYRAPRERRWIHIDQAETSDIASIVISHPEWDMKNGDLIIVHDLTIAISPGKGRINLDAIRTFPEDLRDKGGLIIEKITFDRFQSSTTIQYLTEKGFNVERFSVDTDKKPYLTYVSLINTGRVKAGRNIFLKNNLRSIREVKTDSGKTKIDHLIGKLTYEDGADWEMSSMGKNAKDVSDGGAATSFLIVHEFEGVPRYQWKDIELSPEIPTLKKSESNEAFKEAFRQQMRDNLKNLGLSVKAV
jgi:hypothetical protein